MVDARDSQVEPTGFVKRTWHFGSPTIPPRAVVISVLALSVPLTASLVNGSEPGRFEALLWLSALIPGFLLTYYRGWSGIATGLALGMAAFSMTQVYLVITGERLPDWPYMLGITAALVLISLVVGEVTDRIHEVREEAERMALSDPLTTLPNRRYFEAMFQKDFAAARRGRDLVLVAFDLDGLKDINDRHGHAAGDAVIQAFARVLKANTRAMNLSARLGGDEFVSILSASTVDGALVFVERVQGQVRKLADLPPEVTVSVGVAAYHHGMSGTVDLLQAADEALYEAKRERGSVRVWRFAAETASPRELALQT